MKLGSKSSTTDTGRRLPPIENRDMGFSPVTSTLKIVRSLGKCILPPNLDALVETLRFDLDKNSIAPFIKPCNTFAFDPNKVFGGPSDTRRLVDELLVEPETDGVSCVARMSRTRFVRWVPVSFPRSATHLVQAYHDMATYNITDGTGARPENAGDGFNNTAAAFILIANRYVSIADALVIGTIIAIENCGGPEITFRGRVDAGEANAPGVPQPQDDISTHIADFARQGFSQTEMIGLVACGHTFGGVQHVPFPDIVPVLNDTTNTESVGHFDTTPVTFDNNVATQYISGTTLNPLVVGLNETKNSDKRIFGSDDAARD
ncbi:heme peroxidase [Mycena metata]|uniref:Peroxidase n=1 Tax=Mycena metata TaxID=1033252 RepID=A0AAD7I4N7_9AGAR|nr:heme peroxidase [Mycena metata]